jgi:O-antigen/teichoic acid export membrane protein
MSSLKGIFSIAGWTVLGQVAYLAALPIITRLYTEESIAQLAAFVAIVGIIAPASCLRVPLILPIVADHLLTSSARLSLAFLALVSVSAYLVAATGLLSFVSIYGNGYDALFLSAMIFTVGLWQILSSISTRYRQFNSLGFSKTMQGVVSALAPILIASTALKSMGLLIGDLAGKACSLVTLRKGFRVLFAPTDLGVLNSVREHKHLITRGTLAALCNGFALQSLPLFFIAIWSKEAAASVFLVQRILRTPAGLVAQSVSRVFVSDYSLSNSTEGKRNLQKKYLINILKAGVLPAFIVFVFGPLLVDYAFGDRYVSASLFIRPLLIATLVQVASSSLSQVLILNNRAGLQLAWDASRATSLVLMFLACKIWCLSINNAIWSFTIIMASFDIAHLIISRRTISSSE